MRRVGFVYRQLVVGVLLASTTLAGCIDPVSSSRFLTVNSAFNDVRRVHKRSVSGRFHSG